MGIDKLDEFIKNGFLDQAFLVDRWWDVFEVDGGFDRLAQSAYKFDIDICFKESGAYLFDHAIEGLDRCISTQFL